MKIYINAFGTDIRLKQEVLVEPASPALKDVLRALPAQEKGRLDRFLKDDLSLKEGCVILVNGRNIASLDGLETRVQDGDEVTFTVLVAGG
jgi:molybdopterin converting factor small subunit